MREIRHRDVPSRCAKAQRRENVAQLCCDRFHASRAGARLAQILGRRQVGKARDFDSRIRRFESCRPSQLFGVAGTGRGVGFLRSREHGVNTANTAGFGGGYPRDRDERNGLLVFSGNSNRLLATEVCRVLNVPLGKALVSRFSDGEVQVEIEENVRRRRRIISWSCWCWSTRSSARPPPA
jgi:hypothetical protein